MKTDILLVDGYNIIGAWEELGGMKRKKLADARDRLIERMAEYKAHTGWRVIIVFDAHLVPGIEKKKRHHNVEIVFTREKETADERIEKLVSELGGQTGANSCGYIGFDRTMGHFCAWSTPKVGS